MKNAKNTGAKNIGLGIPTPDMSSVTPDANCPFTSPLRTRGNIMKGVVTSASAQLSATIRVDKQIFVSKYKRYKKSSQKVHAHNPAVINAKVGDVVEFIGCRPISKTKSSVIVRIVK